MERCVVSRQSQLLCLCHGGGLECGELDCIKSRDNCTVNGVEQHLETFVCIIEYFPSAPVVSMSAPVSRLLECGGWHPDNLSSVTRVRCWRRLRVTTATACMDPANTTPPPAPCPFLHSPFQFTISSSLLASSVAPPLRGCSGLRSKCWCCPDHPWVSIMYSSEF